MSRASGHWLVKAAGAAGIIETHQLSKGAAPNTQGLWGELERISGLSESDLAGRIGERIRVPIVTPLAPEPHALRVLPEKLAIQHLVLPLRESNARLVVATADPMDFAAEQALGFASGRTIDFVLAGPRAIERAIRESYVGGSVESLVAGLDEGLANAVVALAEETGTEITTQDVEAKPIVKLTNLILSDAVRDGASDIHIQPVGTAAVVRFRVDGVMRNIMQLPMGVLVRVISRIKVLAQMDIANRVRPQDGRARLAIRGREIDLRVSTVPVSGGEKAVIRILMPGASNKVADLALPELDRERIEQLLQSRDGVIAVTGPTGSGKTTTLYAMLRELTTGENNIVTVEDPIEQRIVGITQMQADAKRGVTFASALRAVMRQDPDVILIGEVRDEETAGIGVQAAMTGHLVLATLHTNDAVGTIPRLADLGVERGSIADNLRGALAQRLLRRICRACALPVGQMDEEEQRLSEVFGAAPTMRARGCDECGKSGYRGRLPVVEVMIVTSLMKQLIANGAGAAALQRAAVAGGMRTMLDIALEHVRAGLTTLDEVERVIGRPGATEDEQAIEPEAPAEEANTGTGHVLLVDDDAVIRDLVRFILGTADYNVAQVADGEAALEYLRLGEPVALVLLDLDMPRLSGMDVLREVRSDPKMAALPIIVLTGTDSSEGAVMDAGADDYIRKPIEPERLLARVRAVLRRASL